MAKNIKREDGDQVHVPVPAGKVSGDPTTVGAFATDKLAGICLTDRDTDGEATVKFNGTATLSVHGEDGSGNAAIDVGDPIYIDSDGEINADATNGCFLGYALQAVGSNVTTSIEVKIGH
jgi:hypothetical protein